MYCRPLKNQGREFWLRLWRKRRKKRRERKKEEKAEEEEGNTNHIKTRPFALYSVTLLLSRARICT